MNLRLNSNFSNFANFLLLRMVHDSIRINSKTLNIYLSWSYRVLSSATSFINFSQCCVGLMKQHSTFKWKKKIENFTLIEDGFPSTTSKLGFSWPFSLFLTGEGFSPLRQPFLCFSFIPNWISRFNYFITKLQNSNATNTQGVESPRGWKRWWIWVWTTFECKVNIHVPFHHKVRTHTSTQNRRGQTDARHKRRDRNSTP